MLGLTGAGGSVLTLPALVFLLGLDPHQAVAASLVSVGATAAIGMVSHARQRHVHVRHAGIFALAGGLAALLGGRGGRLFPAEVVMVLFGALMLFVAWRMVATKARDTAELPGERAGAAKLAGYGAGVGLLSGFLGIGGGFLIVPALRGPARLPMKEAIGTGLAVITINAFAGLTGALSGLDGVPWRSVAPFIAASLLGGWLGARLVGRWSARGLERAFAALVVLVAIAILVKYLPAL